MPDFAETQHGVDLAKEMIGVNMVLKVEPVKQAPRLVLPSHHSRRLVPTSPTPGVRSIELGTKEASSNAFAALTPATSRGNGPTQSSELFSRVSGFRG